MLIIEMNIAKGTSQAAHFAAHTALRIDFHRAGGWVPLDRSRGAHFQAPGVITLQASHGQADFYTVIILNADIGIFPVEISRLAKGAGIFTIAANDAFPNIPGNETHRAFLPISLIY
jgi:hypothetical protein